MLFISPKWKITVLEMSLKSSIMSKLDHQMSIILIEFAGPNLQPISRFDLLKNWVPDCSAQDRNLMKNFRLKTCPQGVHQAQYEKNIFCIFTSSNFAWPAQNSPLKSLFFLCCVFSIRLLTIRNARNACKGHLFAHKMELVGNNDLQYIVPLQAHLGICIDIRYYAFWSGV